MDQRFFLAIALSMVVMVGWYAIFPPEPSKPPAVADNQQTGRSPQQKAPATPGVKPAQPDASEAVGGKVRAKKIRVETPLYSATFTNRGAVLTDFQLKTFNVEKENINWGDIFPALRGMTSWFDKEELDTEKKVNMASRAGPENPIFGIRFSGEESLSTLFRNQNYTVDRSAIHVAPDQRQPEKLVMRYQQADGLSVTKTFAFYPDSYVVGFSLKVVNSSNQPKVLRVAALFGEGPENASQLSQFSTSQGPIWRAEDSISTEDAEDISGTLQVQKPQWMAVSNTYFITAAQPIETKISYGFYNSRELPKADADAPILWAAAFGMELNQTTLQPGESIEGNFKLYLGPRRVADMKKFEGNLESSIYMTMGILGRPMLSLMRWFYTFTENFGFAIILLTIVVRLLLFPLTYKGMLNIKRMQKLQPKMAGLKEKFKKDKEKLNKEMMGLYKKHKMNPLGGCLPILLQIPIFFALYIALSGAIELRHEPFIFWITDLSAKDGLLITPLLMGASMVLQQKLSPTAMDPTQAKIMMLMPIVFTFFMMGFPSGLVVYWLTSNILSIMQQVIINRIKVPEPTD